MAGDRDNRAKPLTSGSPEWPQRSLLRRHRERGPIEASHPPWETNHPPVGQPRFLEPLTERSLHPLKRRPKPPRFGGDDDGARRRSRAVRTSDSPFGNYRRVATTPVVSPGRAEITGAGPVVGRSRFKSHDPPDVSYGFSLKPLASKALPKSFLGPPPAGFT